MVSQIAIWQVSLYCMVSNDCFDSSDSSECYYSSDSSDFNTRLNKQQTN